MFSPLTPEVLQVVHFDVSDSKPGTGRTIVSYGWDFGDGLQKSGVTTTHDFTPSGVYLVTLTVTDNSGREGQNAQPVTVRPNPPCPSRASARASGRPTQSVLEVRRERHAQIQDRAAGDRRALAVPRASPTGMATTPRTPRDT